LEQEREILSFYRSLLLREAAVAEIKNRLDECRRRLEELESKKV
jgi:hypothetical protein